MKVLITGGSRGLGKSLAKQFLLHGDHVIICSRSPEHVRTATIELQIFANIKKTKHARIDSFVADVSHPDAFKDLGDEPIDVWINNAGYNAYQYTKLAEQDPDVVRDILATNVLGTAYGYQQAIKSGAHHTFCMMGGGSKGEATPLFAMYGASKRAAYHLIKSLRLETPYHKVHRVFPGFVDTPLLTTGVTDKLARVIFESMAKSPDDVATLLVPRMRELVLKDAPSSDICYNSLTVRAFALLALRLLSMKSTPQ